MRSLPPLVAGSHRLILPMADRSAAALAEWLLRAGEGITVTPPKGTVPFSSDENWDSPRAAAPRAAGGLAEVLADDPPLLAWSVCRAGQADFSCRSMGDAAGWLAEHALAALQWPAEHDAPGAEGLATEVWAQRVAAAVTLADLAAQLAAENQADRDEAVLGGLLYYAEDWLLALPVPNSEFRIPNSRGAVARAVEVLAGGAADAERSRPRAAAAPRPPGAGRPNSPARPTGCPP